MCVCVYVCVYIYMYVCASMCVCVCIYVFLENIEAEVVFTKTEMNWRKCIVIQSIALAIHHTKSSEFSIRRSINSVTSR